MTERTWICGWRQVACPPGTRSWAFVCMDIASRCIVSHGCRDTPTADHAIAVLAAGIAAYGAPDVIVLGPAAATAGFAGYLDAQAIAYRRSAQLSRLLTPFWRELTRRPQQFSTFDSYVYWHNEIKPHGGVGMDLPKDVFAATRTGDVP